MPSIVFTCLGGLQTPGTRAKCLDVKHCAVDQSSAVKKSPRHCNYVHVRHDSRCPKAVVARLVCRAVCLGPQAVLFAIIYGVDVGSAISVTRYIALRFDLGRRFSSALIL
ncbi:hypothetical protein EJ03DRAFT_327840 [Teratosphaeria nubilosa]|uniref:Uncharacterized protein n=1 Tax=Teratosphaeria nubilosa TaxID=161662 RepID=A0A6G1L8G4_9PEZI|nr:hypothetical protein EJ03DRAFT_327840 [Teratosphaeria nubilosa]